VLPLASQLLVEYQFAVSTQESAASRVFAINNATGQIRVKVRTERSQLHPLHSDKTVLSRRFATRHDTTRYDTRCCFNVRPKADVSQLNLPHGTDN